MENAVFPSLEAFLIWVAAGSITGPIVSGFLEQFEPFQMLERRLKFWVVVAITVVLPVAATFIVQGGRATPDDIFLALQAGLIAYLASQATHIYRK
jgi:hypothetical protein